VTRLARAAFALLVLATLGAFVVTQKLKSAPPLVVRPHITPVFSPAPEARVREALVSFFILHGDDISVSIVDADGRIVRQLASRYLPGHQRITLHWNGRVSSGAIAPDGSYKARVALIHQGRTIDLAQPIRLDTRPPRPRVLDVTPRHGAGPVFLPQHGVRAVTIHVAGLEGRRARLVIYRTDVSPPRQVAAPRLIREHQATIDWDGTIDGAPAPAGTYLMGLSVADRAGNPATFPPHVPPAPGGVSGRAGVTIRHLAAAPPLTPVLAGTSATAFVDARGHAYSWGLRRLGGKKLLAHGRDRGARLRLRVPRQRSGLDVLTLVSGAYRTSVPLVVRGTTPHAVLVVLPALAWQGENRVDDDGDGMPNTLDAGGPVALGRPFADGMPAGARNRQGALLRFLDANLLRYDLTTDVALATGVGPALEDHRGVILAGDERWVTPSLAALLRRSIQHGGRVWSLGTDALRRTVHLRAGTLVRPSAPHPIDMLGARPRQPLVRTAAASTVTIYQDSPQLGLFQRTGGAFSGFHVYETLAPFAPPAELLSAAGPTAGTPVIAAWQLGAGVAIHTGLPELPARALAGDADAGALVQRIWSLLATR
jgi:hypothetical protein